MDDSAGQYQSFFPVSLLRHPCFLPREYAKALGVEYLPPPKRRSDTTVWQAWVEIPLTPEWTAAYFLIEHGSTPVIGEIRIFPTESHPGRPLGIWSGHAYGAKAQVPRGLTMRVLRKVRVGHRFVGFRVGRVLSEGVGFIVPKTTPAPTSDDKKGTRRGRRPKPDSVFVQIAADYAAALRRGEKPVQIVSQKHHLTGAQARDRIHKARERGLLEEARQGIAEGGLTPRGQTLLAALKRQRRRR